MDFQRVNPIVSQRFQRQLDISEAVSTIYNKGIGAYKTNPSSVRPQVRSKEQWAQARVYASLDKSSKAHKIDKIHLKKK